VYIYLHIRNQVKYVSFFINLSRQLRDYFNLNYLENVKSMYICRALLAYGYSSFSVTILNYVNIFNLSTNEAKTKILQCEQFFLEVLLPEPQGARSPLF
jgi:hypothetical protein